MGIVAKPKQLPPEFKPEDPNQPPRDYGSQDGERTYPDRVRTFLDRKAQYEHPIRVRRAATWREGELYEQSRQWLNPSYNLSSTRTYHWADVKFNDKNDPDYIPTPVYNEIARAMQNEAARLGRPEYKPYVRPKGENPNAKQKEAAHCSEGILEDCLDFNNWETDVAEPGYRHMPLYGRWKLKSWWDINWNETTKIPIDGAARCPAEGCGFALASPDLTPEEAEAAEGFKPGRVESYPQGETVKHKLTQCLTCDDHDEEQDQAQFDEFGQAVLDEVGAPVTAKVTVKVPGPPALEPFTPAGEELYEQDGVGRDLGEDQPVGRWRVKTCSPYDVFDEELGQAGDPAGWREILEIHVESLDWVRDRFPQHADKIRAESPEALLRWHPTCGERAVFTASVGGDDSNRLFRNHTRVKEYHQKPRLEWDPNKRKYVRNHGRTIMACSGQGGEMVILMDGDFEMPSRRTPGAWIPRVHYDEAVWEFRSGGRERDGFSLFELLRDVQDNINQASSQRQDARERMASPGWLATRTMNLAYEKSGDGGYIWVVDPPTDGSPHVFPKEVGSTTIGDGVNKEIESDIQFIQRNVMEDVERGDVPAGVTAGNAIQMIAEQAGEHRRPRIRRIRKMLERTWSHGLLLNHEMVPDGEFRSYHSKDETDEWKERTWTGADIMGQTDVKIDAEPEHNTSVVRRENILSALTNKLIDPTQNKKMALRIAKELEVPSEIFEDDDLQYKAAEREFWDFIDQGYAPVLDESLDDDAAHSDQHGEDMMSPKWRELEKQAEWKPAMRVLYAWKPAFAAAEAAFGEFQATAGQPAQPDPLTGIIMPPPEQPAVTFKAIDLESRIVEFWTFLLTQAQQQGLWQPAGDPEAFQQVMTFRAHKCAHDKRVEDTAMAAQMGAEIAAKPGEEATAQGTLPVSNVAVS
jgi:hypothetical protein